MKWLRIITAFICVFVLLLFIDEVRSQSIGTDDEKQSLVDQVIFPHDQVIDVFIEIEDETYNSMLDNAMSEEVVMANMTYNGYTFSNIGIRPKGNSSLRDVANSESDRYSYKVDIDYYIDDQNFYGITKLNLNNIFSDPTMMAEYLGYEMMEELDADASRTNYVALYINDEYMGLYLAVEQVNETFLKEHYGNTNGELYKPDMGTGSDLAYISDNGQDYTGLYPENLSSSDNEDVIELMKVIEEDGDLETVLNVDSFLKYLAMSTITIHMDAYQSGMYHNYYLYNNNGIFEWITWDLNMIFNGFPMTGLTDEEAISFLIDEPVIGSMEGYPLIEAIFKNDEYVTRYHEYIEILLEGYLSEANFTNKVMTTYDMIKDYVEIDPSAFYTYDEFEEALFQDTNSLSLLSFVSQRSENVYAQLNGTIPSTNNGQGNTGSGKGMGNRGGMKSPEQDGMQPAMQGDMNQGMKQGKQQGMQDGMQGGLPSEVNLEDIPEELKSYFENGEMPPREKMMEFMDEMPEGFMNAGGKFQGQDGQEQQVTTVNIQSVIINSGLLLIMLVGMIGFTYYLKKR